MPHHLLSYRFKIIAGLIIICFVCSEVHAARKGRVGSQDRTDYCKSKMDKCVEDANEDCRETYGYSGTEVALCKSSEVNVCKNTYGSSSDCLTRDLKGRDSKKATTYSSGAVVLAPENNSGSKTQKEKTQQGTVLAPVTTRDHRTTNDKKDKDKERRK